MTTKPEKVELTLNLKITVAERTYLRSVLYSELKRLTDHRDHAHAHGDLSFTPSKLTTIQHLIEQFEYRQ